MVASILKDWDKEFGIVFKRFWKLIQLHSYVNTPRKADFICASECI